MKLRQIRARAYRRLAKVAGMPSWLRGTKVGVWYRYDATGRQP